MAEAGGVVALWRLAIRKKEAYRCQSTIGVIYQEDAQLGSMLQRAVVSICALGLAQVSLH